MAAKKSPVLHIATAVVAIMLLMAFTVLSVGIFAEEKSDGFDTESQEDDSTTKEIYYFQSLEQIHSAEDRGEDFYIVVFDVGTTGTRAHVFHFRNSQQGNGLILLSDEVFTTAFTLIDEIGDPYKTAKLCLSGLVVHVTSLLPTSALASTKVLLKATDSFRRLPDVDRQSLVQAAYDYLKGSPLLVEAFDDTFGVLDSEQEGLYQWITINYVTGVLTSVDAPEASCGVIGIGGGSVQITFEPTDPYTLKEVFLSSELNDVQVLQHSVQLYTHRIERDPQLYGSTVMALTSARAKKLVKCVAGQLGFGSSVGRVDSRFGILETEAKIRAGLLQYSKISTAVADVLGNSAHENDINENTITLHSVCLPSGYTGELKSDNSVYDITATTLPRPHSVYDVCTVIASVFLDLAESSPIHQFSEVHTQEFYVLEPNLRYFTGMSDDADGTISLDDINDAAKRVCKNPKISEPFACIDLIYTYTLLHHGFQFSEDAVLHIDMSIRMDAALSWALGFAIDWLQNHPSS